MLPVLFVLCFGLLPAAHCSRQIRTYVSLYDAFTVFPCVPRLISLEDFLCVVIESWVGEQFRWQKRMEALFDHASSAG
jgi:hypothetical protein